MESVTVGHADIKELSSSRHMYINTKIENTSLNTLIDTGASGFAFIYKGMCKHLKLPLKILKFPITLVGFEGKSASQITERTNFSLVIGNHSEQMSAFVIPDSKYDLILGLPWLEKHSPYIDWKEHTLTFGERCLESCCCKFETTISYFNSPSHVGIEAPKSITPPPASVMDSCKLSRPVQISAQSFFAEKLNSQNEFFAMSLRDLDILLDDSLNRLHSIRIGEVTKIVPVNPEPKEYLPPQYHDYLDVFDRKQANSLPPHRPWDHSIDLQPDKTPPVSRPYSMNQRELKTLREYLDKELAKGFIRVSRSPAAAPVLFVKNQMETSDLVLIIED